MASLLINHKKIKKIAGADIHQYLLEKANRKSLKVFYLGSSNDTLDLIKRRINKEFPFIQMNAFSPPYKSDFSRGEIKTMIKAVNEFKPDILFVGMTAPKQEKWVQKNRNKIHSDVIVSIGAVFDFYAGKIQRVPKWLIDLGMAVPIDKRTS